MKKLILFISILSLLVGWDPVTAEYGRAGRSKSLLDSGTLDPLTQFENMNTYHLISDGRYVYIDTMSYTSSSGFERIVLDTIDPEHPIQIASLPATSYNSFALAVANNTLYTRNDYDGIAIYDVADPANPGLIGQFKPVETMVTTQMVISGSLAYIADHTLGLAVLDISDPAYPTLLGTYFELYLDQLTVQGPYVYARTYPGLSIYDVSDPAQIIRVGRYEDSSRPGANLTVNGSYAYLNGSIDHFPDPPEYFADIIDVSDPADPERVGEVPELAGLIRQLGAKDGMLYAVRWDGLAIFSTTDPVSPQLAGVFPSYWGSGMVPLGDRMHYLDFNTGFSVLDTSDPAHPTQMGFYSWPQSARYLTAVGTTVYSADNQSSSFPNYDYISIFRVIDAADPFDAQVLGYVILDSIALGKPYVDGSFVYVPTGWGMEIIDASDPANMHVVAPRPSPSFTTVVEVLDGMAYSITEDLGGSGGYFTINDVSNPFSPTLMSQSLYLAPEDMSIASQGEYIYAYVISSGSLIVLDVTDPVHPLEVFRDTPDIVYGLLDTENRGDQKIAYLAGTNSDLSGLGVMALDVSNPANPVYLGTFLRSDILGATILEAKDGFVYFAIESDYTGGVNLVDFTDPAHPYQIASANAGGLQDASLGDEFIYTTVGYGPITVFSMKDDLTGRVTDHNSNPIAEVTLTLSTGADTLSDADGVYLFPDLSFGDYVVTPTLSSFVFHPSEREVNIPSDRGDQDFIILPAPVSTTLEPGTTTTLTYTDVQGMPTSFIFPTGLFSTTATALVTPTLASGFFGTDFAGHAFELAIDTGLPTDLEEYFSVPVSVTIQYSLEDTAVITDTAQLALYQSIGTSWMEADTSCIPSGAIFTQEPGVFRGAICQEGLYALLGPAYSIALPIVSFGSITQSCEPPNCNPLPPLSKQE